MCIVICFTLGIYGFITLDIESILSSNIVVDYDILKGFRVITCKSLVKEFVRMDKKYLGLVETSKVLILNLPRRKQRPLDDIRETHKSASVVV